MKTKGASTCRKKKAWKEVEGELLPFFSLALACEHFDAPPAPPPLSAPEKHPAELLAACALLSDRFLAAPKKRKKTVIFKARKIIGAMCRLRPAFLLLFVALTVHLADANFSTNDSVRLERRKRTRGDKDIQKRMKAIF